jgi:glycosyltransferase involved in cell wall biosynthesis
MRVVHVLRKCDPAEWGGTETALERLFGGLREYDVDSVVYRPWLASEPAEDPLVRAGHRVERFKAFVPVVGMSRERRRQLVAVGGNLMSFDLVSALWREEPVAVIHAHALGRLGGIALTVAKRRGLPYVVTIHGGVMDLPDKVKRSFNAPAGGWDWGKLFGLFFQSHRLLQDADAIVTCNEKEAVLLRQHNPAKRIVVQPHGVPLARYQQDHREEARKAFPQIRGRQVLLSLGRIDPIKNQGWLLEEAPRMFQAHSRALLVLAGACTDESYGAGIHATLRKLGLAERVLLTGGLPPDDPRLIGLLQEAAVLVLPSLSETFGLVLLEAWAAGTSVLSSRTSGAKALVRTGENGWLFDLDRPQTFHEALNRVLSNPDEARRMAERGAAMVRDDYSVSALAGRMKALYEQLIEDKQCAT